MDLLTLIQHHFNHYKVQILANVNSSIDAISRNNNNTTENTNKIQVKKNNFSPTTQNNNAHTQSISLNMNGSNDKKRKLDNTNSKMTINSSNVESSSCWKRLKPYFGLNNNCNSNDDDALVKDSAHLRQCESETNHNSNTFTSNRINSTNNNCLFRATTKCYASHKVLYGNVLANCFTFLQLKELNLIARVVSKSWADVVSNPVSLQKTKFYLDFKTQQMLISQLMHFHYPDDSNNGNALLNELRYAREIEFKQLTSADLFVCLLRHCERYITKLILDYGQRFNCEAINDQTLNNLSLNKLQSLTISPAMSSTSNNELAHLLTQLLTHINRENLKYLELWNVSAHPTIFQIFEEKNNNNSNNKPQSNNSNNYNNNNTYTNIPHFNISPSRFSNLENLRLGIYLQPFASNSIEGLSCLSNLTELKKLTIRFCGSQLFHASGDFNNINSWKWLSTLKNLNSAYMYIKLIPVQAQMHCFQMLTTLPLLTLLATESCILDKSNEYLKIFGKFQSLTKLILVNDKYDRVYIHWTKLRTIQFPNIPNLIELDYTINSTCYTQHIMRILVSNPQLKYLKLKPAKSESNYTGRNNLSQYRINAKNMIAILENTPCLQSYFIPTNILHPSIICSTVYPTPLVYYPSDIVTASWQAFVDSSEILHPREELINRLKNHTKSSKYVEKCDYFLCSPKDNDEQEEQQPQSEQHTRCHSSLSNPPRTLCSQHH